MTNSLTPSNVKISKYRRRIPANKSRPPYTMVALIPAALTRPLQLPFINANCQICTHNSQTGAQPLYLRPCETAPVQTQLAVVGPDLRCSFPYVLLCHLVPVRVLSYLQRYHVCGQTRPIDIQSPALSSTPISYILSNAAVAFNCSSQFGRKLRKWKIQGISHGFPSSFGLPIKRRRYPPRQTNALPSSQNPQIINLLLPQPQKARSTSSKRTNLLRSYGSTNFFSYCEAPCQ